MRVFPSRLVKFDDRLILQKVVYLLQESGLEMGYRYHWYLRGPYSTGLTDDAYFLVKMPKRNDEQENWELDESSLTIIERVKG